MSTSVFEAVNLFKKGNPIMLGPCKLTRTIFLTELKGTEYKVVSPHDLEVVAFTEPLDGQPTLPIVCTLESVEDYPAAVSAVKSGLPIACLYPKRLSSNKYFQEMLTAYYDASSANVPPWEQREWVGDMLSLKKLKIEPKALTLLEAKCGGDLGVIYSAINTLNTLDSSGEFTYNQVLTFINDYRGSIGTAVLSLLAKDRVAFREAISSVTKEDVVPLTKHLSRELEKCLLSSDCIPLEDKKSAGLSSFTARELYGRALANWGVSGVCDLLKACFELESHMLKGGKYSKLNLISKLSKGFAVDV